MSPNNDDLALRMRNLQQPRVDDETTESQITYPNLLPAPAEGSSQGFTLPQGTGTQAPHSAQPAPDRSAPQSPTLWQGVGEEQDDMDETRDLSDEERLNLMRAVANAPENPREFQGHLNGVLPFAMKFNFLMKLVHPDKFPAHKEEADAAFKKLTSVRDNLGGDRHVHFWFGKDKDSQNREPPPAHAEGELSSYHKEAHAKATPYLKVLFDALGKDPNINPSPPFSGLDRATKSAAEALTCLNASIQKDNQLLKKDVDTGLIQFTQLCARWRPGFLSPPLEAMQDDLTRHWCGEFGYPKEWANLRHWVSPVAAPTSSSTNSHPMPSKYSSSSANSQPAPSTSSAIVPFHDNGIQIWNSTAGNTRTIAIPLRTVARSIKSGYTSSGEMILCMQRLGLYSARFVVQDSHGAVRFASCAECGGQPALQGAISAKVPVFLQDELGIRKLRDRVRGGGIYGLFFAATTPWDTSKQKMPYIATGFWHIDQERNLEEVKVGLSRSALKTVLSSAEGERLIGECMTGQPGTTSKDALYMMCPDVPRPMAPLARPWYPQQQHSAFPQPRLLSQPGQAQAEEIEQQIQMLQAQLGQVKLQQPQPQSLQPQSQQLRLQSPQSHQFQQLQQPQQQSYQAQQFQQPQLQQFQQPQLHQPQQQSHQIQQLQQFQQPQFQQFQQPQLHQPQQQSHQIQQLQQFQQPQFQQFQQPQLHQPQQQSHQIQQLQQFQQPQFQQPQFQQPQFQQPHQFQQLQFQQPKIQNPIQATDDEEQFDGSAKLKTTMPYYHEAYKQATAYLRTIYDALSENPFLAFHNPYLASHTPPIAARNAVSKLDEINLRLMDRNILNEIDISTGQIKWQDFIKMWKTVLIAEDIRKIKGETYTVDNNALPKFCQENNYPIGWASLPPC
ncbi:hypothetical protein N7492_001811 [Penicillium capsulatum]|uniref:J domain-containing protein n=1 Tax=Penicillium capsulatum TaxID=69766 RepID=A0A9W9M075_9EURO|nr:hypothetical protein N7492_001811 [Penicillium capsulatum]KAJ6129139.1 hypothetical protein N7512_001919 [Penicillium capsulatum]